jgi:hypothetical protein
MAHLSPSTLLTLARELYDYELSDSAAATAAHMIGAVVHYGEKLRRPARDGLQPPLSYSTLLAEAERLRRR